MARHINEKAAMSMIDKLDDGMDDDTDTPVVENENDEEDDNEDAGLDGTSAGDEGDEREQGENDIKDIVTGKQIGRAHV